MNYWYFQYEIGVGFSKTVFDLEDKTAWPGLGLGLDAFAHLVINLNIFCASLRFD